MSLPGGDTFVAPCDKFVLTGATDLSHTLSIPPIPGDMEGAMRWNPCPRCGRAPHLCELYGCVPREPREFTPWQRALIAAHEAQEDEEDEGVLATLQAIVAEADRNPFNPIGHVIEHVVPHARAAIEKAMGEA